MAIFFAILRQMSGSVLKLSNEFLKMQKDLVFSLKSKIVFSYFSREIVGNRLASRMKINAKG